MATHLTLLSYQELRLKPVKLLNGKLEQVVAIPKKSESADYHHQKFTSIDTMEEVLLFQIPLE